MLRISNAGQFVYQNSVLLQNEIYKPIYIRFDHRSDSTVYPFIHYFVVYHAIIVPIL
jgi:hypothetical protein